MIEYNIMYEVGWDKIGSLVTSFRLSLPYQLPFFSLVKLPQDRLRQNSMSLVLLGSCKGNLTDLRRELHLSLAKGNPK
jgi:hypothetical protein